MTFGSLRVRLLIGGAILIALALCVAAAGLSFLFERHVERWVDDELVVYQNQLIAGLDLTKAIGIVNRPPPDPRFERPLSGLYWQVKVGPDRPALRSRSLWDFEIEQPGETHADDKVHHYRVPGPQGSTLYLLQRSIRLPVRIGDEAVLVAVAIDSAQVSKASWAFASALAPFLAVIGALLTLAAWAQVTIGLRPLRSVRERLAAIASGNERRLGSAFPTEIQPLAREIDSLLDARELQAEKAKARAADLAHALKTPLQVLSGEVARLRRKGESDIADAIEEVSAVMQSRVDRQLAQVRLGSNKGRSAEIPAVIDRVVRVVQKTPEGQRLTWSLEVPNGLQVRVDADDLAEAFGNLLENAARHAETSILVRARSEPGFVNVTIADDGPGILVEQRERALQRGIRFDSRGHGAGLGLAIVADIAEAWGIALSLEDQQPGLRVRLRIPASGNGHSTGPKDH